jgi:hypothetical protein
MGNMEKLLFDEALFKDSAVEMTKRVLINQLKLIKMKLCSTNVTIE